MSDQALMVDGHPFDPSSINESQGFAVHFLYDTGILCLRAQGKKLVPTPSMFITNVADAVTCKDCLELIHS